MHFCCMMLLMKIFMTQTPNTHEKMADDIRNRLANGHRRPTAIATHAFKQWLVNCTVFLPDDATITQRLYHLDNPNQPTCKMCECRVSWRKDAHRYSTYCSSKCAHNDPSFAESMKHKMVEKHGVEHFSQTAQAKHNRKQTTQRKYGVDNNFWANRTLKEVSDGYFAERNANAESGKVIEQLIADGMTQGEIGENLGRSQPRISHLLKRLGQKTITNTKTSTAQRDITSAIVDAGFAVETNCRIIHPNEVDIYIPSHNLAIEVNGVYWHSELAGRDRKYHLQKTKRCNELGIRLIHIFDTEWNFKQPIVQSRLMSFLGASESKIYARQCNVVKLDRSESDEFFDQTHIQGTCRSQVVYALELSGQIVAAMSFGRSRYDTTIQYELLRFSNKLNTNVIGAASRLFAAFVREYNPNTIVSYSDIRWNTGGVYNQLGFVLSGQSAPNYFYFDRCGDTSRLLSRINFQKHKLNEKLEVFDPSKTEWENMQANGYDRIWDCGNTKWVWSKLGL